MAEEIVEQGYRKLADEILEHNPGVDLARVRAAFELADRAHAGQKRKAGTPYVTHCIEAARICVEMGLDEDSVVAALLHDVIEDTALTHDDIAKEFGAEVADIVEGVTKLTRVRFTNREDEQMENLRKMLMAMAKDIRVILIKLADRLHNMRTMEYMTPAKQLEKSTETMEIYAPIAHRLGLQRVKWELEDRSLRYIDPEGYREITEYLESKKERLDAFMAMVEMRITKRLAENGINATVQSRIKHTYSIYRKMYAQNLSLDGVFDLCAFRVIVDNIADCYNVLGHIHDMYRPVPGRFKDYVASPKPNGYQSVQTTVIGEEGIMFEVQIRTWEMHRTAEYGIAAHWKYKSGEAGVRAGDEEKFAWIRQLLEAQQESDAGEFVHDLKMDMFDDEVFVFTPQGDVVNLPAGACPIDFAYGIHSAVGNSMIGAKVNGRIVPFDYALQNGDIVDILTSKSAPGPSRDWMNLCKSNAARTKIRQWLKKERREENILRGREMFEGEMRRAGLSMAYINDEELVQTCIRKLAVTSLDDMYAAIGYGGITSTRVVNRFRDEIARAAKQNTQKTAIDKINEAAERRNGKPVKAVNGVLGEGMDNCLIKFSRCCTPVPGDPVVGFITRGQGISVHRADCPNYLNSLREDRENRWIHVDWADTTTGAYSTTLRILAHDRNGLVLDIATVLNSLSAKVLSLNARGLPDGNALILVTLEVPDLSALRLIMGRLRTLGGVRQIERGNG